ncbi:MAG: hypothetical protein HY748_16500 [Elusimicrobia bacterium]|nr:hypothetical protein [Elusimicrobiota bacterium]
MKLSRRLVLTAGAACVVCAGPTPALEAQAAEPAPVQLTVTSPQNQTLLMSQDPLTRQILQQLTKENGGVKAVVRVANGQGVELRVPELGAQGKDANGLQQGDPGAIPVLTPHPDLVKETKAAAPTKRKPAKKATDQLKTLQKQGRKQDWESQVPGLGQGQGPGFKPGASSGAKQPAPVEPGLY